MSTISGTLINTFNNPIIVYQKRTDALNISVTDIRYQTGDTTYVTVNAGGNVTIGSNLASRPLVGGNIEVFVFPSNAVVNQPASAAVLIRRNNSSSTIVNTSTLGIVNPSSDNTNFMVTNTINISYTFTGNKGQLSEISIRDVYNETSLNLSSQQFLPDDTRMSNGETLSFALGSTENLSLYAWDPTSTGLLGGAANAAILLGPTGNVIQNLVDVSNNFGFSQQSGSTTTWEISVVNNPHGMTGPTGGGNGGGGTPPSTAIPTWLYIVIAGIGLFFVIVIIIAIMHSRSNQS